MTNHDLSQFNMAAACATSGCLHSISDNAKCDRYSYYRGLATSVSVHRHRAVWPVLSVLWDPSTYPYSVCCFCLPSFVCVSV